MINGYKVKSRVVTFYVAHDGVQAEIDVSRKCLREWSGEDMVRELARHKIPAADVHAARAEVKAAR